MAKIHHRKERMKKVMHLFNAETFRFYLQLCYVNPLSDQKFAEFEKKLLASDNYRTNTLFTRIQLIDFYGPPDDSFDDTDETLFKNMQKLAHRRNLSARQAAEFMVALKVLTEERQDFPSFEEIDLLIEDVKQKYK